MRTAILVGFWWLCNAISSGWEPPNVGLLIVVFVIAGTTDTVEFLKLFNELLRSER